MKSPAKRSPWRRTAQIVLAVIALLSATAAGFRYLARGGTLFGEHVVVTPGSGPVGLRPFFEFPGYDGGRDLTVYLCAGSSEPVEQCASLGKGKGGERLLGNPIPKELPSGAVTPGRYVLRAGPDDEGGYPQRGSFEVAEFKVGPKPRAPSFERLAPTDLAFGEPRRIARGAPCTPPQFLADGRVVVGANVVDPESNVTIEMGIQARELAWSPVGDKLAILTVDRKEIQLAAPDGSEAVTRVREARGLISSLSWSPTGDRLAFIADRDPATRQLAGDPTGPTVKILNATNGTQSAAGPGLAVSWAPDADVLAVEMAGSVIERSTPTGERSPLTQGSRPSWSHDGSFLGVIRTEGDQKKGWVVPSSGQGGAAVTPFGTCAISFSPAGDHIAEISDAEEQTAVLLRTVTLRGQSEG